MCRTQGVGMVEVLVALVVLSIGMLGTASLYVAALQAKTTALSRMQAVNLASDLADRIRANRKAGNGYALTTAQTWSSAPAPNCVEGAAAAVACTAAQMANMDLYLWSNSVTETLPGSAERSVAVTAPTATTAGIYVITLNWTEASSGTAVLTHVLRVVI
jgi:type IV pilus assembly protein PilV